MGANDSRGVTSLGPRGLTGRIYVGDHETLLHNEYVSCGPHVSEKKIFKAFPIISLWEFTTPWGVASLDPRGLISRIYVGDL